MLDKFLKSSWLWRPPSPLLKRTTVHFVSWFHRDLSPTCRSFNAYHNCRARTYEYVLPAPIIGINDDMDDVAAQEALDQLRTILQKYEVRIVAAFEIDGSGSRKWCYFSNKLEGVWRMHVGELARLAS